MNPHFIPISKLLHSARNESMPVAIRSGTLVPWSAFYRTVNDLTLSLLHDPADEWILYCQDSLHFAEGLLALLHANKKILLPHNIQSETLNSIVTGSTKILSDTEIHTQAAPVVLMSTTPHSDKKADFKELDPHAIRLNLFTSGSTGNPKLVVKPLIALEAEIMELEKKWGEELADSFFFSTVVHQHIYGLLFRILWPLCRGSVFSTQLITTPEELAPLDRMTEHIVLASSPAFLKRLQLLEAQEVLSDKKFKVFSSGGLLATDTALAMKHVFGACPMEVLGSTETGGVAYRTQEDSNAEWTPFSVVHITLDADGQLLVSSPYIDGAGNFPMGDTAECIPDSDRFILKGRIDKIVKIEEKRISLSEIESRLEEHAFVEKAVAVPLVNKRQIIGVALILSAQGKAHFKDQLKKDINAFWRDYLLKFFEPVVLPRKWRYVEELPMNAQGKLLINDIKELFT